MRGNAMEKAVDRKGFTLVELMVSLAIFAIVIGFIYGIFIAARKTQTHQEMLVGLAQEARGGLEEMVREMRMAGAPPRTDVANVCSMGEGVMLITNAPTDIEMEGDFSVTGQLKRVRYFYDAASKSLNRWEYEIPNENSGTWGEYPARCTVPLANSASIDSQITKQVVAYGIDSLNFEYFNKNNAAPENGADIVRVGLTVTAKSQLNPSALKTVKVEIKLPNLGTRKAGSDLNPPAVPGGVTAVNRRVCGYLGVTWSANSEADIAGYKVYYKPYILNGAVLEPAGEWYGVKTVGLVTSTEFGGLVNGTKYQVAVAAYDTSGNLSSASGISEVVIADDINPLQVAGLTAVRNDVTNTITLSWTQGQDPDVAGRASDDTGAPYQADYYIYRDTSATGPFSYVVAGPHKLITNTTIDDVVPTKCLTYYYKVRAVDSCSRQGTLSAAFSSANTMIFTNSIDPPQEFFAGVGTTTVGSKDYYYARFSGTYANDPYMSNMIIEVKSGGSCPGNFTAKGEGSELPGRGKNLVLDPGPTLANSVGAGYTGNWDGVSKTVNYYRFAAFTKSKCSTAETPIFSTPVNFPVDSGNCLSRCQDSPDYSGSNGLGDACIFNHSNPVKALVCDKIKIFWETKDGSGNAPAACSAYGPDPNKDFYPDEGDGGYIVHRGVDTDGLVGGETYRKLAPDPVTGPIQPFYYLDGFYDGNISSCEYVSSENQTFYRDRCSYRYKIHAVDCQLNQSASYAEQQGNSFRPGFINNPDASYVKVEGKARNKVVFLVKNTAAAALTWTKALFTWRDSNARLNKIEICNSEPSSLAVDCNNWETMWSVPTGSSVTSGTLVDFGSNKKVLAASPLLGAGNATRAKVRLTFISSTGSGQRMDDGSEKITVTPYYENASSTTTDKTCPADVQSAISFEVVPIEGPGITGVKQNPPARSGLAEGDAAITAVSPQAAPPSGNYRSYAYDTSNNSYYGYYYFVDNVNVTVRASISPHTSGAYPVQQCGDTTNKNKGVLLYYTVGTNTATAAPVPKNASNAEDYMSPANYTVVQMCNENAAADCSSGTCVYKGTIPAQTAARVWYYLAAWDNSNDFSISPPQTSDTSAIAYTYDAKEKVINYIWPSEATFSSNKLEISYLWINRIKAGAGDDPLDTATAGSTVTITVTGKELDGDPQTEVITKTTSAYGAGCRDCWQSESGFSSSVGTTQQFAQPTVDSPLLVRIEASLAGFTGKVCEYKHDGSSWSRVSADSLGCK